MGGVAVAGLTGESIASTIPAAKKTPADARQSSASKALADTWAEYHAALEEMCELTEKMPRFQDSPPDAKLVTSSERQEALALRRKGLLKRYGE